MRRELKELACNAADHARRLIVCGVMRQHWFMFDDTPDVSRVLREMVVKAERGEPLPSGSSLRAALYDACCREKFGTWRRLALYDADVLAWMNSLDAVQHVLTVPCCVDNRVATAIVEDVATRREHSPPRDRNAVALARELDATYTGTRYDAALIGVLGDALEDAGAETPIVQHLRKHPFHVRGCWVIDAILAMC